MSKCETCSTELEHGRFCSEKCFEYSVLGVPPLSPLGRKQRGITRRWEPGTPTGGLRKLWWDLPCWDPGVPIDELYGPDYSVH